MPLFTVTMKSNGSTSEKDAFPGHPRCKHCCWISRGRPLATFLSKAAPKPSPWSLKSLASTTPYPNAEASPR
jgi:hypothetical protein